MTPISHKPDANSGNPEPQWKKLYRYGGISALIMVMIVPVQIVVFSVWPPPQTAVGWFELFHKSPILGLLSFEFLFLIYGILSVPVGLALYFALRRTDPPLAVLYLALNMLSVVAVFTARPAFEMLHLSGQYAAAATDAQKSIFLAAGESMIAIWHGTAYLVCYVLGSINGLIVSLIMLRGKIFDRGTASTRILSSLLMVWNILVGRRLIQLARVTSDNGSAR
jgi:hypothetical protein